MLLLPASVTAREANDTRRLLLQALKCQRAADAWGKPFALRNSSPKLAALAKLYGVDVLLMPGAAVTVSAAQR
jgi:phospholipid transport system transporter-binding protein